MDIGYLSRSKHSAATDSPVSVDSFAIRPRFSMSFYHVPHELANDLRSLIVGSVITNLANQIRPAFLGKLMVSGCYAASVANVLYYQYYFVVALQSISISHPLHIEILPPPSHVKPFYHIFLACT
uniref:Solute carrier family 40 protein n=1 Tax=Caenorhabditis tropicalis TaxID=1561998 RepID=A0A1I7UC37_9PELO